MIKLVGSAGFEPATFAVSGRRPNQASPTLRSVLEDRKSTRLNSSHSQISYAVFCLKKKITRTEATMGPVMRHLLGASLSIRHNLSSSQGLTPLTLTLFSPFFHERPPFRCGMRDQSR